MLYKSFFLLILIITAVNLFAQGGTSLSAEIQNLERNVTRQGISAIDRHETLVRLAHLRQLSGDIEGAAKNWLEAASAIPGSVDDDALLACAFCLAAMGEWERAAAALEPLLSKNIKARFLNTAINSINTGNTSALEAMVNDPGYSQIKHQILFFLWKVKQNLNLRPDSSVQNNSAERWRLQLISEFPQTPEGRLAADQVSSSIVINPNPFWFFISGFDSLPLLASEPSSRTQVVPPAVNPVQETSAPQQAASAAARLQTGVFSRERNAQSQMTALRRAGFSPSIEQRTVNNTTMWAVTVPSGPDANRTISDLRTAGFESFLIR
jgi:tetratricopeptide (TPR) repeat protein